MKRDAIRSLPLFLAFAVGACGGDNKKPPDAPVIDDAPPDMALDAPSAVCDYTEAHDATNDYNLTSGFVAEATGITFSGSSKVICGKVNNGHYSATNGSIDIDDYLITLASDADVIVSVTGSAQNIQQFGIFANDMSRNLFGSGYFTYDHGVFSAHLAAGMYHITAEAYANADIAAPVSYRIKIASDTPATRCAKVTTTANYIEAHDGTLNADNDVVQVQFTTAPFYALTAATTDAPEPTALTIASGTTYRVSGNSAIVAMSGDTYYDKDTYLVTTGVTSDQLAIRLNWPSTTADLDLYVFQPAAVNPPIAAAATIHNGEDEFLTMASQPNAMYWLWVGSSTAGGASYDLSICGETFTP